MTRFARLCQGLCAAALSAVGAAFQLRNLPIDGNPLPVHLLELEHGGKPSFVPWDMCNTNVFSNLGGLGPDDGPPELRFKDIGTCRTGPFDLLVMNTSTYLVNDINRNTARGCFGVINVAKDSSVDLTFSLVTAGTSEPACEGESFFFSMFDLDCSATGCEQLTMLGSGAKTGYDNFYVDDHCELLIKQSPDGMAFTASTLGYGSDNPPPLEALQKSRAVTFEFSDSSMAMNYKVENSKVGRNFLFAGKTVLVPKKPVTTTTLPGSEQCHSCIVWGDPHVITFDVSAKREAQHPMREAFFRTRGWKNDELSIYDEGTFWLVKSERVHIQARYWHNKSHPDWTNLGALAIGGDFLKNNTLIIRSESEATTWNGQEILSAFPSRFENEYVQAHYHHTEVVSNGKRGIGIDIKLPDRVKLTVNRWSHSLAVMIDMCPQAGGQEGQCGNYNGISSDDVSSITASQSDQRVPKREFIF